MFPDQAEAFVAARIAEGSDYIKIVYDGGAEIGRPWQTIDEPTLTAVIRAAKARKKLAVVHVLAREFARRAPADLNNPGLIIGGDFTLTRERIAIAGSALRGVRTDQDAYFTASVTVIIEAMAAKATSSAVGRSSAELQRAQATLGKDAIGRALD